MGAVWTTLTGRRERAEGAFYKATHVNERMMQQLQSIGMGKRELFELHQIFSLMDRDSSGEINLSEFFTYIDVKRTRFSEKAFSVMDRDGSGEVDFLEFVLAVWNYCSFSHTSLVRYAFDLYDSDGSGEIELDEASRCVREIWGSEWEQNANAQKVMGKLEALMRTNANNRLTIVMFQEFAQRHPILLFPAFQLQTEIQQRILGPRFWRKAAQRRAKMNSSDLNWQNFQKIVSLSRQSSQKFLQNVDDALHDELTIPTPIKRKQSRVAKMISRVRSKPKVFLGDADDVDVNAILDIGADSSTEVVPIHAKPKSNPLAAPASSVGSAEVGTASPASPASPAAKKKKKKKHKPTADSSNVDVAKGQKLLVVEDYDDGSGNG